MNQEEKTKLINAWISYHKNGTSTSQTNDQFWAWEMLDKFVSEQPELAWEVILGILAEDQSAVVMTNVAAGPLENLMARHGRSFVDRIDQQARKNSEFRFLLNGVWSSNIDPAILKKLTRYRKNPW
ncbi:DUF6869 domain-containing protein [Methylophilus flavus]|uniref:DUF6869 domain-containing protein n=1 Tax=Methylophilus flavus TaxID=640084 RepID=A0ABW3P7W7_9PROT